MRTIYPVCGGAPMPPLSRSSIIRCETHQLLEPLSIVALGAPSVTAYICSVIHCVQLYINTYIQVVFAVLHAAPVITLLLRLINIALLQQNHMFYENDHLIEFCSHKINKIQNY
uniref:Uncharacterized protein n=1 Tax=Glossina brevipalpis TaxID=37001 RepID=A0A1A9W4H9_9MUSC